MIEDKEFDDLLRSVLPQICYEDCCKAEQQMLQDGRHEFSTEFEEKMNELLSPTSHSISPTREKIGRIPLKYLFIAVLLFVLCSSTVLAFEPVRVQLKNIVYTVYGNFFRIDKSNDSKKELATTDSFTDSIIWKKPSYVPDEYTVIDEFLDNINGEYSIIYENESEEILSFFQYDLSKNSPLISGGGSIENYIVDERNISLTSDETNRTIVFFEDQHSLYVLLGILEKQQMIEILATIK